MLASRPLSVALSVQGKLRHAVVCARGWKRLRFTNTFERANLCQAARAS